MFFLQIEKIKSKLRWVIRLIILIGLVATTALVAIGGNRNDNQTAIINLAVLEIIVWDLVVMPILIAMITRRYPKWGLKY